MSPITLLVALAVFTICLYKKWQESRIKRNYPPGPPRWPLIGSYHYLLWTDFYRPHIAFTKWAKFYQSPIISWGMGDYTVMVTNDYDSCKEALTNPSIQGRVPAYPAHIRTYGKNNGYFADDGPRWQTMKRQTLRALRDFGFGRRSEPFEAVVADEMQKLISVLKATNAQPVNVPLVFFHSMLNLISEITYGFRYPEEDRPVFTNMGKETLRLLSNSDSTGRLIAVWPWIRHLFPDWSGETELRESSEYFQKYIEKFLDKHQKSTRDEHSRNIMDFMIRSRERFPEWTDEEIIISIMDLTFPNVAATVVVAFVLGYLVNNPEKLRKCQEEIDSIVGRSRLPDLNDRTKLKMVEASIRETMRLQPVTPLGLTHRATEDTELGGYFVPKESLVIINQHAMNYDSRLFPEPEEFKPERFTNGKDQTFSFGLGKRVCVGETFARQNMFVMLAAVLQNFNIEISTNIDPDRIVYGVAAIPNHDFALKFLPR